MDYKDFNHEEIETIAEKFTNGEYVSNKEIETWYRYRQAVIRFIEDREFWTNHEKQYSEIEMQIVAEVKQAESELTWIKSICTFDLEKVCEYIVLSASQNQKQSTKTIMAKRVLNGASNTEKHFIREILEESDCTNTINYVRRLTTPVANREWCTSWNNPTQYFPTETPMDCTELYDGQTHYVYIQSACQGRYGETYWISNNANNTLTALPVIKAFKEFDFQIGKFYKITCTDTIHFGRNKKKYVMDIEESNEAEFLEQGFIFDANDRKFAMNCY